MTDNYIVFIISLLLFTLFCGGSLVLQIYLSWSKLRWPGLIQPGISVLFSLIVIVVYATSTEINTLTQNGTVTESISISSNSAANITFLIAMFLACNIPTLILLAIYAAARGKRQKTAELERMNVQELE